MNKIGEQSSGRLFSLDLLRGLDMFLLVVVGGILRAADKVWGLPPCVMEQMRHPWGGFTLWDLIMPLFIFMCGAAMPFALGKRMKDGRPTVAFWRHVAYRVALLWVLGMVNQGQLLTLDPMRISPFNNTLQTIAVGYLISAFVMCVPSKWFRRAAPLALMGTYTVLLAWNGDYSKEGNFAMRFELKVLSLIVPDGSEAYRLFGYTWFLTSLMFGAMTLIGFNATLVLKSSLKPWGKVVALAGAGSAMAVCGWAVAPVIPMIKQIYTLSFTLSAMGCSCILLAVLYALTDICGFRCGTGVFVLYGQFALWAYMAGVFRPAFAELSKILFGGLSRWIGQEPMAFVYAIAYVGWVTLLLVIRRRFSGRMCCYDKEISAKNWQFADSSTDECKVR